MNHKLIVFCSIITALIGAMIGVGAAEISQNDFESDIYQNLHTKFALVGAAAGLLIGAGQEAVRELKEQQDQK